MQDWLDLINNCTDTCYLPDLWSWVFRRYFWQWHPLNRLKSRKVSEGKYSQCQAICQPNYPGHPITWPLTLWSVAENTLNLWTYSTYQESRTSQYYAEYNNEPFSYIKFYLCRPSITLCWKELQRDDFDPKWVGKYWNGPATVSVFTLCLFRAMEQKTMVDISHSRMRFFN